MLCSASNVKYTALQSGIVVTTYNAQFLIKWRMQVQNRFQADQLLTALHLGMAQCITMHTTHTAVKWFSLSGVKSTSLHNTAMFLQHLGLTRVTLPIKAAPLPPFASLFSSVKLHSFAILNWLRNCLAEKQNKPKWTILLPKFQQFLSNCHIFTKGLNACLNVL